MMTRKGFTFVELLVVIAIIGILVALLLPAVQTARESARRTSCVNNLKQLALGVHGYHDAHKVLPSLYNGPQEPRVGVAFGLETFSWYTELLPFIEEQSLQKLFDYTVNAVSPANQPAINQRLTLASCPSTPRASPIARGLWYGRSQMNESLSAATSDYGSSEGYMVTLEVCAVGAWGELIPGESYWDRPRVRRIGFKHITDGLSQTALILERAGLPDHYFGAGNKVEPHDPPTSRTWGNIGLWAISADSLVSRLQIESGIKLVNGDNLHGLYSFHPGGAHVAFADGAVRMIDESIETETLLAMITRAGGEVVDPNILE